MTSPTTRAAFDVGHIHCVAMNDGTLQYPPAWFFSNVSAEQIESGLRAHHLPTSHVESPYTCLLVRTGKHEILIDTGAGGLAPTTGQLTSQLASEGLRPEQITHVLLTHGHPDHIGGVLNAEGKRAFPNAQYLMSKKEWDFWTNSPSLNGTSLDAFMRQLLTSSAEKNLPPLTEHIELLEGENEIVPGISVVPAPGHTPGHLAVTIASGQTQFLHMSDAVLHPLHLENPSWRPIFDLDAEVAAKSRQRLLDRAANDRIKVLAYHFAFPGMGRIESRGTAWKWLAD